MFLDNSVFNNDSIYDIMEKNMEVFYEHKIFYEYL